MAVRPDLSAFAAGCALSAAGVYAAAYNTARGRSADAQSLGLPGREATAPSVSAAAERAVGTGASHTCAPPPGNVTDEGGGSMQPHP